MNRPVSFFPWSFWLGADHFNWGHFLVAINSPVEICQLTLWFAKGCFSVTEIKYRVCQNEAERSGSLLKWLSWLLWQKQLNWTCSLGTCSASVDSCFLIMPSHSVNAETALLEELVYICTITWLHNSWLLAGELVHRHDKNILSVMFDLWCLLTCASHYFKLHSSSDIQYTATLSLSLSAALNIALLLGSN